ncbi:MAG: ribosome-associated translation inhibitor RaiA, partial [Deltaproteobacteria bacterium]|nr:ribosome-associated translation inhibitor RaiA [Deltaproteobacteria bacterium]
MRVNVTFRHMESSEALKSYAIEKAERLGKYLSEPIEIHWVLYVEKIRHIAESTVFANGVTIKAQSDTQDMYSAIDETIEKLEYQVRKHKEKVKDHKPHNGEASSIRFVPAGEASPGATAVQPRIVKKENLFAKP